MSRVKLLVAMNTLIVALNDERAYFEWIELVPDQPTLEDFQDIAEDNDLYAEACLLFRQLFKRYGKSGFYISGDYVVY